LRKCEFCGEEIAEGALACPRCGSPAPKVQEAPKEGAPTDSRKIQGSAKEHDSDKEVPPEKYEAPLAPEEVDFIALAEESLLSEPKSEPARGKEDVPDVSSIASQDLPPGAEVAPEPIELESNITGGYKGPEGPSVAGAGEQTAEDPFGLNITEKAPPVISEGRISLRARERLTPWLIIKTIISLAVLGTLIFFGVRYGFMQKNRGTLASPEGSVYSFMSHAVNGDYEMLNSVAVPGAPLITQVQEILNPYSKEGILRLKELKTELVKSDSKSATVKITNFIVEQSLTSGEKEMLDILSITKPYKLPTTINLVNQNGKWLISS